MTNAAAFSELRPGAPVGPLTITVSSAANERYWRAAGVEHPALAAGALYPPIAANLTILAFQQHCPDPVIQTRQRLVCHRRGQAGTELVVRGRVTEAYSKRGRDYVDVETTVAPSGEPDAPLWSSLVSFTPAVTMVNP